MQPAQFKARLTMTMDEVIVNLLADAKAIFERSPVNKNTEIPSFER